jgi:hypothetical protein
LPAYAAYGGKYPAPIKPGHSVKPTKPAAAPGTDKPYERKSSAESQSPAKPSFGDPRNSVPSNTKKQPIIVTPNHLLNKKNETSQTTVSHGTTATTSTTTTSKSTAGSQAPTTPAPTQKTSHQQMIQVTTTSTTTPMPMHQHDEEKKKKTIARMAQLMHQSPYYEPPVV